MMRPMNTSKSTTDQEAQPDKPPKPGRAIDAQALFGQSNVVLIEFKGECYQLRLTRNGKLILTK